MCRPFTLLLLLTDDYRHQHVHVFLCSMLIINTYRPSFYPLSKHDAFFLTILNLIVGDTQETISFWNGAQVKAAPTKMKSVAANIYTIDCF
jgi:hypothetical protein